MHICCVCTGNTCRSPMLATLLQQQLEQRGIADVQISSCGVGAADGYPASDGARQAMQDRGLDLSTHQSSALTSINLGSVERFYCMSDRHAQILADIGVPIERLAIVAAASGGVPDPFGMPQAAYNACAEVLAAEAERIVEELQAGRAV